MQEILRIYREKKPEVIFEWNDAQTEARGWVVINSLRNGAAGGGTRMRKGLTCDEVIALAKVMEIKFSVSGPAIGGAKSGIDFDPSDPRREEVLQRWYKAVYPLLKNYYGTGGDLNVDELRDVIPITEKLGLWHPQEGIVNGHLDLREGEKVSILGQLRHGISKIVEDPAYVPDGPLKYAVADLATGFGVAQSVLHYYRLFEQDKLDGKRAIIQGWGNVASAAAAFLAVEGVKVVGIIDRPGGLIQPEGMGLALVKQLYMQKKGNKLQAEGMLSFEEANEKIWDLEADIFIPGAASRLVTRDQVDRMLSKGLKVISCGANVPFTDDKIFFGPTAAYADTQLALIPDFIANSGMARVFAYLMQPQVEMTDTAIFHDISDTIGNALERVRDIHPEKTGIAEVALRMALEELVELEPSDMTSGQP